MEDKIVKDISLDNKYLINLNQPEEKIEMLLKVIKELLFSISEDVQSIKSILVSD